MRKIELRPESLVVESFHITPPAPAGGTVAAHQASQTAPCNTCELSCEGTCFDSCQGSCATWCGVSCPAGCFTAGCPTATCRGCTNNCTGAC